MKKGDPSRRLLIKWFGLGALVLLVAGAWVFGVFQRPFQSQLVIHNNISSYETEEELVFKDCSTIEKTWGSLVSSHGIKNSATFTLESRNSQKLPSRVDEYVLVPQCQLLPGGHVATVYVQSQHLENFASIVHHIPFDFVLVSGDEDVTVPQDVRSYESLLSAPRLLRWHTQNLGVTPLGHLDHQKFRYLPIGLDLHTLYLRPNAVPSWGEPKNPIEQEVELFQVARAAAPLRKRQPKILCNFHFTIPKSQPWLDSIFHKEYSSHFRSDRDDAEDYFSQHEKIAYFQKDKLNRKESWQLTTQYAFVASPHGHGLDCHRTWEALVLGSIPIVKTSSLDEMWAGLPVLVVQNWSDITHEMLKNTLEEFRDMSKMRLLEKKLRLQYWLDEISALK